MTKKHLFEDLERLREKCHYSLYDAERVVEVIFPEARHGASQLNPDQLTDKEIEDYLEKDSIVKQYLDQHRMTIGELIDALGLRK